MPTQPVPHDQFFSALSTLLSTQSSSSRGSVFLTQKRMPTTPTPSSEPSSATPSTSTTPSILVRASNGKHKSAKTKISTVVSPDDLEGFYARYAEVCKGGMTGMKKRDRSAKKKGKGKKEKKTT